MTGPTLPVSSVLPAGFQAFSRSATLTVGTLQIQAIGAQRSLDFEFSVRRSLKAGEANTCDVRIYNLSAASRKAIEQASQRSSIVAAPPTGIPTVGGAKVNVIPVQVDAGYVGHTSTIFLGEMSSGTSRSAQSVVDGPDYVTELNSGDGDTAMQLQRINASIAAATSPVKVVQTILAQMGIGAGNLGAVSGTLASGGGALFQLGTVLKGNAAWHLARICASVGLEFSVQHGAAQFLKMGQPLAGPAYNLSASSGLVGSPTADTAGICSFTTLILPGLLPGAPVSIDAAFVQGDFRILSIEFEGSTFGNEWYARCEAARYGVAP